MSASLRWLAVSMCCVFVLYLIPNLLSNNDCKGFVSEKSSKTKKGKSGRHPSLLRRHPFPAGALWSYGRFWNFMNVLSETCQSPWFKMARRCLWNPGAYVRHTPESGDPRRVYLHYWFFAVMKSMFVRLKWTRVSRQFTGTFSTLLTCNEAASDPISRWVLVSKWSLCADGGVGWGAGCLWEVGVCLEQKMGRGRR